MCQPELFIELGIFLRGGANPFYHQVESFSKLADFISTANRHSGEELAVSDGLHGGEQRVHGAVNPKIQEEVDRQNDNQTLYQDSRQFQAALRPLEFVKKRRREFRIGGADEPAVDRDRRGNFHAMRRFPTAHIADRLIIHKR